MLSGIQLDVPYIRAEQQKLSAYAEVTRAWLLEQHGVTSPGSGPQITRRLQALGQTLTHRTKGGALSADKDVLTLMGDWASNTEARQLAKAVLGVRHAEKLVGSYLDNFLEFMTADGVIHASINPMAARTGRSSVTTPALQTLPRDDKVARGAFVPRPGHVFISCDLDQVEARMAAHFSRDPGLIDAFLRADRDGTDFFCGLASQIFQTDILKSDRRRQNTKNVTYGEIYGSGLATMATTAGVPMEQMRPVKAMFEKLYPGIKALNRHILAQAAQYPQPCVFTPTGRRLVGDADRYYTQLLNALIQGHAAEYLKTAVLRLDDMGYGPYLRMVVHDEIIAEVPTEMADQACRDIGEAMTDRTGYAVPITAAAKIMPERWAK
jgi:DNA polymerase-1